MIRKTETSQEIAVPGSGDTTITKLARTEYEVRYCQNTLQLAHPEQEEITRTIPDTYIGLASRDLVDGGRISITISDTKNNCHINKILEVKQFGLEVYSTTPIMLAYRPSTEEGIVLAPSPGTSVIFKIARRRKTLFEDWLHPAINIAFLDFDPKQSLEIGLGVLYVVGDGWLANRIEPHSAVAVCEPCGVRVLVNKSDRPHRMGKCQQSWEPLWVVCPVMQRFWLVVSDFSKLETDFSLPYCPY